LTIKPFSRCSASLRLAAYTAWPVFCALYLTAHAVPVSAAAPTDATAAAPTDATAAAPTGVAAAFAQLGNGRMAIRNVSLADLGMHDPVVLHAPDARQELYLPVPADVPISNATFQFDGTYLHADGGHTTMLLSLDGAPVLARALTLQQGDAAATIGVDGTARPSGFVRVGLGWSSVINDNVCADQTAIGNVLRIGPTSRLTYSFDPAAIKDLRTAWSALPQTPVVMTSARGVTAPAFDAGWRAEAQLQREGKTPVTRAWPVAGDTVDLSAVTVPDALRAIPAFAALAAGGLHKLANPAEAGALVALAPHAGFAPDVIVADDRLRDSLKAELDALRTQVDAAAGGASSSGTAATVAFDAWRTRSIGPIAEPLAAGEVRLAHLAGQVAIVVGDNDGVAVLARAWRAIDVSDRLVVHQIDRTHNADVDAISLSALGGQPRTLNVLGRATWDANFDLAAVSGNGKLPSAIVLDVSAMPTLNGAAQTAAIYINDVLIGAQLLNTNGKPQRITAHVPHYALASGNLLHVVFERQPEGGCQARSEGQPIAVLPTSNLQLDKADLDDNFTGMAARFATNATLIVPSAYLDDTTLSLARVARLANAAGIVPSRTMLSVAPNGEAVAPKDPFLAADVALKGETSHAMLSQDRLTLTDASGKTLADVSGLKNLALIDVVRADGAAGIVYRATGETAPVLPASLQLTPGDVAVVDAGGVAKRFDTLHPGEVIQPDNSISWFAMNWWRWGIPAALVALFLVLLLVASIARRRHRDKT
jgi:Bacterial cellulose synthase subunit